MIALTLMIYFCARKLVERVMRGENVPALEVIRLVR